MYSWWKPPEELLSFDFDMSDSRFSRGPVEPGGVFWEEGGVQSIQSNISIHILESIASSPVDIH